MEKYEICRLSGGEEKKLWIGLCRILWQEIFQDSDAYMEYYERYKCPVNDIFLLCEEAGEIASMLQLNPYRICQGGDVLSLHYIVGVCTRPDRRGRGYMGALLKNALGYLYHRGEVWTYLMPVAQELYEPYDFIPVYQTDCRQECWERGEESGEEGNVLVYGDCDVWKRAQLEQFANRRLAERFSVFTCRDGGYFAERAEEMRACGGELLVLERAGEVVGYLEYLCEPQEEVPLEVVEAVFGEGEEEYCYRLFRSYVQAGKGLPGGERVCRNESGSGSVRVQFDETEFLSPVFRRECDVEGGGAEKQKRCVIMARIVCLETLLRKMTKPAQWPETLCIEVRDPILKQNSGTWRICFREEGNRVERTEEKAGVTWDIRRLAELYFKRCPFYVNELT